MLLLAFTASALNFPSLWREEEEVVVVVVVVVTAATLAATVA